MATMEMHRPKTVVIKDSPMPEVTAMGLVLLSLSALKDEIMPVMVPKRPKTGESDTITPK